jgi:hypothetical protein
VDFTYFRQSAIVGAVLVLPLLALEAVNGGLSAANLPIPLFAILWLLPVVIGLILMPMVRQLRTERVAKDAIAVAIKSVLVLALAWMWLMIVVDQMPCFLGVPNCD